MNQQTPANPVPQIPGCLPNGYTLDSLLTIPQFAIWQQISEVTVRRMLANLPGVIKRSRENIRIHPRTYLEMSVKRRTTPKCGAT
jgi:hypothetical protein